MLVFKRVHLWTHLELCQAGHATEADRYDSHNSTDNMLNLICFRLHSCGLCLPSRQQTSTTDRQIYFYLNGNLPNARRSSFAGEKGRKFRLFLTAVTTTSGVICWLIWMDSCSLIDSGFSTSILCGLFDLFATKPLALAAIKCSRSCPHIISGRAEGSLHAPAIWILFLRCW